MKLPGRVIAIALTVAYPFFVFFALVQCNASPRIISLALLVVCVIQFVAFTTKRKNPGQSMLPVILRSAGAAMVIILVLLTNSEWSVRLYPVVVSLSLLSAFVITLFRPPAMILRFALLQKPSLKDSDEYPAVESYCIKVTVIWCCFFVLNALIAMWTTFFASSFVWSIYNGFVSYILIGVLLVGEYIYRRVKLKK